MAPLNAEKKQDILVIPDLVSQDIVQSTAKHIQSIYLHNHNQLAISLNDIRPLCKLITTSFPEHDIYSVIATVKSKSLKEYHTDVSWAGPETEEMLSILIGLKGQTQIAFIDNNDRISVDYERLRYNPEKITKILMPEGTAAVFHSDYFVYDGGDKADVKLLMMLTKRQQPVATIYPRMVFFPFFPVSCVVCRKKILGYATTESKACAECTELADRICQKCDKAWPTAKGKLGHWKRMHEAEYKKSSMCKYCLATFSRAGLANHQDNLICISGSIDIWRGKTAGKRMQKTEYRRSNKIYHY